MEQVEEPAVELEEEQEGEPVGELEEAQVEALEEGQEEEPVELEEEVELGAPDFCTRRCLGTYLRSAGQLRH